MTAGSGGADIRGARRGRALPPVALLELLARAALARVVSPELLVRVGIRARLIAVRLEVGAAGARLSVTARGRGVCGGVLLFLGLFLLGLLRRLHRDAHDRLRDAHGVPPAHLLEAL